MGLELGGVLGISLKVFKDLLAHLINARKSLLEHLRELAQKNDMLVLLRFSERSWYWLVYGDPPSLEWGEDLTRFKTVNISEVLLA